SLDEIYKPVREELREIDRRFAEEFSAGEAFVAELLAHVSRYRGKRLRPALLLLSGKAAGSLNDAHIHLAMAVESIHTATLVHDDVLDEAALRRYAPTINKLWGNEASVLLGDYLFAAAFRFAARAENNPASRLLSETSSIVCEGELLQIGERNNFELSEERYIEIVRKKTASLCSCACRLGVLCAAGDEKLIRSLAEYGENLGVAFQIVDDCLDLAGDESETGKSLGTDLSKGKFTLPLLHLLRTTGDAADLLKRAAGEPEALDAVRDSLLKAGSIDYALSVAGRHAEKAKAFLTAVQPSPIRTSLEQLAAYVVQRKR
ncbi:MAG: polyprenyl synthetase family protein, partial [Planctomycetota bacterium]